MPTTRDLDGVKSGLEVLGHDLVLTVFEHAELEDVITLRQCSRMLQSASKSRSVWLAIFQRYLGTVIPLPFFLSNPLAYCSSRDIELAIKGWTASSRQLFARPFALKRQPSAKFESGVIGSLPGGRFFISSGSDGSIWYHDSRYGTEPPKMVLPAVFPLPTVTPILCLNQFEVDVSLLSEAKDAIAQEFNILVGRNTMAEDHIIFRVCRLTPQIRESGELGGYTIKTLMSFNDNTYIVGSPSIHGKFIAYSVFSPPRTVIVDWTTTMTDGISHRRAYIAGLPPTFHVLLPHDRILIMGADFLSIYRIQDCPVSLNPHLETTTSTPVWHSRIQSNPIQTRHSLYFKNGSVRVVIPTCSVVLGIIIPNSWDDNMDSSSPNAHPPQVVDLLQHELKNQTNFSDGFSHSYGYHKAVLFAEESKDLLQYSWPDDPPSFREQDGCFPTPLVNYDILGYPFFNESTNQIVAYDHQAHEYLFIDL
ncbi:hypothetical protein FA15DRAFT_672769 [Coprinopsis marcescibilis]|uniref:F-box domain-containing protein n=1 Tax=Coprinopsis marcescibilis TaxID=230819 RepID=A0A5C3KMC1_COPMA|nr:hypothetical protein FA15DRAFT_672769 [Coprinopsis marcescibilis]